MPPDPGASVSSATTSVLDCLRRWYGHRAVSGRPISSITLLVCGGLASALVAGCGGTRQDANEPSGSFNARVVQASFPAKQSMTHPETLQLAVRNTGARTMPDVAITVDGLTYNEKYPLLSDAQRPTWIIDEGPGPRSSQPIQSVSIDPPGGGQTAYVNTWALGSLPSGRTKVFTWHLTPVKAGTFTLHYAVAAGLAGKAHAVFAGGAKPIGQLTVHVASKPSQTHVNADTGAIAAGPPPVAVGPVGAVP
jgi:hypothetical protein